MAKNNLSDKEVRALTDEGKYRVAEGLYVIVSKTGKKGYYARIKLPSKKRSWRVIGDCDKLSIVSARKQALLLSGETIEKAEKGRTFKTAFNEYVELHKASWKNNRSLVQWNQTYKDYIDPKIGAKTISEIKPFHIAELLSPLWLTKSETARRIRGRIAKVIDYEQSRSGVLDINPAEIRFMRNLLTKQKDKKDNHFEAPTLEELKELYQSLTDKHISHLALKWTIEQACRTTETREATWSEIENDCWVIPASRMKGGILHRSPIVGALPPKTKNALLFPNSDGEPLSLNGMRAILQKRNIKWTVHGIRSCFRTWAQGVGIPDRVAEQQLAHTDKDKIQRAYARSDLLEERRVVMNKWIGVLND